MSNEDTLAIFVARVDENFKFLKEQFEIMREDQGRAADRVNRVDQRTNTIEAQLLHQVAPMAGDMRAMRDQLNTLGTAAAMQAVQNSENTDLRKLIVTGLVSSALAATLIYLSAGV